MIEKNDSRIENSAVACECDTFEFMANKIGMRVLHPGGIDATDELVKKCGFQKDMTILDIGCGRGSTSIFLAKKYGCRVVGIDIDQNLLSKAYSEAKNKKLLDKLSFKLANIYDIPFVDEYFDGAIIQAMLIFTDKEKALGRLIKKIKYDKKVGILELAWKKKPPPHIYSRVKQVICSEVRNSENHTGWINLLENNGFAVEYSEIKDIEFNFRGMLRNEGYKSAIKIVLKSILDKDTKNKTKQIGDLFRDVKDYLGYGIYVASRICYDRGSTLRQNTGALGDQDF